MASCPREAQYFGLSLWVVFGICVGVAIVLVLFLISLWFTSKRNKTNNSSAHSEFTTPLNNPTIPNVSKEIQEIRIDPSHPTPDPKPLIPDPGSESEPIMLLQHEEDTSPVVERNRIHIEIRKDHRIAYLERVGGSGHEIGETRSGPRPGDQTCTGIALLEVSHLGWGHWYSLRELEELSGEI